MNIHKCVIQFYVLLSRIFLEFRNILCSMGFPDKHKLSSLFINVQEYCECILCWEVATVALHFILSVSLNCYDSNWFSFWYYSDQIFVHSQYSWTLVNKQQDTFCFSWNVINLPKYQYFAIFARMYLKRRYLPKVTMLWYYKYYINIQISTKYLCCAFDLLIITAKYILCLVQIPSIHLYRSEM